MTKSVDSLTNPPEIAFSLENISKSFADPIFRKLSLTLNKGEVLYIVGANGCGKSTLLKIIAGLLRAEEGVVEWHSPISKCPFGYYSQDLMLYRELSVLQNLSFFGDLVDVSADNVFGYIERFELSKYKNKLVDELSAGYRGRAALCRAFMMAEADTENIPGALFLDEPSTALDTDGFSLLIREIENFRSGNQGRVAVVVTHCLERFNISKQDSQVLEL